MEELRPWARKTPTPIAVIVFTVIAVPYSIYIGLKEFLNQMKCFPEAVRELVDAKREERN